MAPRESNPNEGDLIEALRLGINKMSARHSGRNPKFEAAYLKGEKLSARDHRDLYAGIAEALVSLGHDSILGSVLSSEEYRDSLDNLPPRDEKYSRKGSFRRLGNGKYLYVRDVARKWDRFLPYIGGKREWFEIRLKA